jgi:hypothetical protein
MHNWTPAHVVLYERRESATEPWGLVEMWIEDRPRALRNAFRPTKATAAELERPLLPAIWLGSRSEPGTDAAELHELAVGVEADRIQGKAQRIGGGLSGGLRAAHVIEPRA